MNSRDWTKGCTTTCSEEWTPKIEWRAALQLVLRNELHRLNKGLHYNLFWGMNSTDWTKGCTTTCPEDQWTPEIELRAALQLVLRTNELQRLNKGLHYNLFWGMNSKDWTKGCTTTCLDDQWFGLVRFLFYGPSTHFRSFRAWSVILTTLFLGKPRQFTSALSAHSFASNWQLLLLNQRKRENGRSNLFMTKSPWKNAPDVGIELRATCMPSRHASDRVTTPGQWTPETELRAALQLVLRTNELQTLI